MSFIKTSWKAAKLPRIVQAVFEPKKTGSQMFSIAWKKPLLAINSPKA
jgi:hypothetical protein